MLTVKANLDITMRLLTFILMGGVTKCNFTPLLSSFILTLAKQQTYSPNVYSILCFCDVQPYELMGANAFETKIEHFGFVYLVSLS